ncbi:hypothetical protein F5B22DRAFT_617962 [Xylaria bambusicola]|uniref:uncharacterized protein n=1 Tax=Xylaria bambusicola TaxID=326684 RepID=UPI0020080344|nr:uncharacterized protein F5B22DRAFT_617962 [Xylaria bambusicola]KAI0509176.1 hypothetical protein F5B22DRAFT_617962 [Xylaria bambusicola]
MAQMYADVPLAILHTPQFETGETDPFTVEASHMVLSHNSFIRGFNSIYQQAPRVKAADKADFVEYCIAWHDCVDAHHHYEETELFPNINKACGRTDLMSAAVEEHATFFGGMGRMKAYLQQEGANFNGDELIAILDSFKDALHSHLKAEPPAIVALKEYSTAERPIDILGIADAAGKKQVNMSFVLNVLPVFLLNMETADFEEGMWHDVFPPFKGVVKWVLTKAVPAWHSGRWRFVSCSPDGSVKQLAV